MLKTTTAIIFITLCVCARASAGSLVEDASYMIAKKMLIAGGLSEARAECTVKIMKLTGVTADVMDVRHIINPPELIQIVHDKAEFADFVCSPIGIIVLVLLVAFVFAMLCVCCKLCCRDRHKPMVIPIISSSLSVPYTRMDMVMDN